MSPTSYRSREVHDGTCWRIMITISRSSSSSSSTSHAALSCRRRRRLLLLLLIRNPSSLGLTLPDLPQVNPDCTTSKRVGLRGPTVLLISSSQPPYQSIQASPGLPERARARRRRLGLAVKHAALEMDFGLPELVEVPEELEDMAVIALGERHWGPLVLQVLPKSVPVPPLLRLVPAGRRRLLQLLVMEIGGTRTQIPRWRSFSSYEFLASFERHRAVMDRCRI